MSHAKHLDNASGKLFLVGFIAAKLRLLPITFLSPIFSILSLLSYLIGYTLWLIACHFHPDHPPKQEAWYGFSQFKNQNRFAAAAGFIGISLCLLSFAFPVLLLPGTAIFAISNIVWSIAEYHKRQNPPNDPSYSPARQNYYVSYAILSSVVSVITAASLALVIIFPPIGVAALFFSALIGFSLTAAAFYFLLSSPPTKDAPKRGAEAIIGSHSRMHPQLSPLNLLPQQSNQINPSEKEPLLHSPLFPEVTARDDMSENKAHQAVSLTFSSTSPSPSSE